MRLYALQFFVDAFGCIKSSAQIPQLLTQRVSTKTTKTISGKRYIWNRSHHAIASFSLQNHRHYSSCSDTQINISTETKPLTSLPTSEDTNAWVALVEPYLPPNLRNDTASHFSGPIESYNIKPIRDFHTLLDKARSIFQLDLLTYIGIHQGRWKAVFWLITAMLEPHHKFSIASQESNRLQAPRWTDVGISLQDMTKSSIWADDLIKPLENIDVNHKNLTDLDGSSDIGTRSIEHHKCLGQIWQSLGHMILHAADCLPENAKYADILSHVFQILAHLHHINTLPNSIYNYNPAKDPFVIQRPPTLKWLSFRIMAVLSDAAWNAGHDAGSLHSASNGKDLSKRKKSPKEILQPRAREVSIEIWLELILWTCCEGGWILEAAWIVSEIDKRRRDPNIRWSVIKWESVDEMAVPKTAWSVRLEDEVAKSRLNQLGGFPFAKLSAEAPVVKLPRRTISREVIMVLVDGLANTWTCAKSSLDSIRMIRQQISACKRLLATEGFGFDVGISNSIILRLAESEASDAMHAPEMLEQVLHLSPTHRKEIETTVSLNGSRDVLHEITTPTPSISLSLINQTLYHYAKNDNIRGALRTFRRLQEFLDAHSKQLLHEFFKEIQQPTKDSNQLASIGTENNSILLLLGYVMPSYVLASFIEFIIRAELWEVARWLLYSDDVDGPTISTDLYSDPSLQAPILQLATATADAQLLVKITEQLKAPLSPSILRALLHCQIVVGKWTSVEDVFSYFPDRPDLRWDASDAMRLATVIIFMENDNSKVLSERSASIIPALNILQKLISGEFNNPHNPSKGQDLSQIQLMNQLGRIFRSIPGTLSKLTSPYLDNTGRANAPAAIDVDAFNILIKGVVDCKGPRAGKDLWNKWCRDIDEDECNKVKYRAIFDIPYSDTERVVHPNLRTLRLIIQPLIQHHALARRTAAMEAEVPVKHESSYILKTQRRNVHSSEGLDQKSSLGTGIISLTEENRGLIEWAVHMYRKFGLQEEEILEEIPRFLLRSVTKSQTIDRPPEII